MSDVQLPEISQDHKNMAMYAHIGGGFTFGGVPILIYLLKGNDSPYIKYHAAQAALFSIAGYFIYIVLSGITFGLCSPAILAVWGIGIWKGLAVGKGTWEGYPAIGGVMRPPEAG